MKDVIGLYYLLFCDNKSHNLSMILLLKPPAILFNNHSLYGKAFINVIHQNIYFGR